MSKYFLILFIAGIVFFILTEAKKSQLKQKHRKPYSKMGETTVYQTKKNQAKVQVDAEDVEFEEIKKHER